MWPDAVVTRVPPEPGKGEAAEGGELIPSPRSVEQEAQLREAGQWELVRRLTKAPGADLYEAQSDRRRALVQVVLIRPDHDRDPDRTQAFIHSVAKRTTEKRDQEMELLDHGVAQRPTGSLALYWAIPWHVAAEQLKNTGPRLGSPDELVIVAHDLLERLVRRHERKVLDPLLSEGLLVTAGDRGATILGYPLLIDPRWTDDEMAPPRLAAFEVKDRNLALSPAGDLFRLGRALEELGRPLGTLPRPLLQLIQRFQQRVKGENYASSRAAIAELEELDARGALGVRSQSLSSPRIANAQTLILAEAPRSAPEDEETARGHSPKRQPKTDLLQEPAKPRSDTLEMPQMRASNEGETGDLEEDHPTVALNAEEVRRRKRGRSVAPTVPLIPGNQPTQIEVRPPRRPAEPKVEVQVPSRAPVPEPRAETQPEFEPWSQSPDEAADGPSPIIVEPEVEAPRESTRTTSAPPRPADMESLKAAGPKGTVVGVRLPGPEHFARPLPRDPTPTPDLPDPRYGQPPGPGAMPGPMPPAPMYLPPGMLPGVMPPAALPPPLNPGIQTGPPVPGQSGSIPPVVRPRPDVSDDLPEVSVSNKAKLGLALAVFAAGVLALAAVEYLAPVQEVETEPLPTPQPQLLRPPRDVSIRVEPSTAILVGELDGTTLGAGRADILVSKDPPAVLVAAPGHVPARVQLPQRGTVSLELAAAADEPPCAVRIEPPTATRLEAVADSAEQVQPDQWAFRGAGLFRAVGGRGAWLVPCPEDEQKAPVTLPPRPATRDVQLQITWPPQGEVFIDGEPQGSLPVSRYVPNGFTRVRVKWQKGEVERWLPVFSDTRAELPDPPASKP